MRVLTRMWQMLLKSLDEVAEAPNSMMAAEMAIIRLTHVADLPTPEDLVRRLQDAHPPAPAAAAAGRRATAGHHRPGQCPPRPTHAGPSGPSASGRVRSRPLRRIPRSGPRALSQLRACAGADPRQSRRQAADRGRGLPAPRRLPPGPDRIHAHARRALGSRTAPRQRAATLDRQSLDRDGRQFRHGPHDPRGARAEADALETEARAHPLVEAVFAAFPKARITEIKTAQDITTTAEADALPEVEDEWDPFEDD